VTPLNRYDMKRSRRLSLLPAACIAFLVLQDASCSSRKETRLPEVENLVLRHVFKEGLVRRYRLKVALDSPAGGPAGAGRNLSISWDQKVVSMKGGGAALIESRIGDVVFETAEEGSSKGEIGAAVQKALKGAAYTFEVSARGDVAGGAGPEMDWEKAFGPIFEKNGTPSNRRGFTVDMARLNFSRDQILAILTLPFISLPEGPVSGQSRWEQQRKSAVFGIGADTSLLYSVRGFDRLRGGTTALEIAVESTAMGGSCALGIPSIAMPVTMQVSISEGKMEGEVFIDPSDAAMIKLGEHYEITVEAKAGLPSLKAGEAVERSAGGVKMPVDLDVSLELVP
jgi:hypothetical protein